MRVAHIITGLDMGGAEMMLFRLLSASDRTRFVPEVISLKPPGPVGPLVRSLGVPVHDMGFHGLVGSARGMWRLAAHLRRTSPAVIQTWMYHADLLGGIVGRLAVRAPVCWGLHNSTPDPSAIKPSTMAMIRGCAAVSRFVPTVIVSCSRTARHLHVEFGYPGPAIRIIPNGVDLDLFRPASDARQRIRAEFGIGDDTIVIGSVGRYHPQKDYANFVAAASQLHRERPDVHFVLCGDGLTWDNTALVDQLRLAGIAEVTRLLGRRSDVAAVEASFDVMTLSSAFGEAFPLAIAEAMACGVTCVATDLGDTAELIGDTGRVVPVRDPQALAAAWQCVIRMDSVERARRGRAARARVAERYSLAAVTTQYQAVWSEANERHS